MFFRSIGCTIVEMLTQHPPWHEFETMAAIFKIATTDKPQYTLPKKTSKVTEEFLELCFYKDPVRRRSGEDLLQHKFCS